MKKIVVVIVIVIKCKYIIGVENITTTEITCFQKGIYEARRKILPAKPTNLQEVHEILKSIDVKTNEGEQFLLINDGIKHIILFSCETNLRSLTSISQIYVDGTFRCCTKYFYQLFTIHAFKNGHYYPIAYFLLSDKKFESYQNAFEGLIQTIMQQCKKLNFDFKPDIVFVDFETNIHKAIQLIWPLATIKGCRFHLGQSWWRKIQSLGLSSDYKNKDSDIGKFLKYVFGLPFLEPEMVGVLQ